MRAPVAKQTRAEASACRPKRTKSRMVSHFRVGPDNGLSTHGPAGLIVRGKKG
jgi:hypothetical protein